MEIAKEVGRSVVAVTGDPFSGARPDRPIDWPADSGCEAESRTRGVGAAESTPISQWPVFWPERPEDWVAGPVSRLV